jgi:hypothetical protein
MSVADAVIEGMHIFAKTYGRDANVIYLGYDEYNKLRHEKDQQKPHIDHTRNGEYCAGLKVYRVDFDFHFHVTRL